MRSRNISRKSHGPIWASRGRRRTFRSAPGAPTGPWAARAVISISFRATAPCLGLAGQSRDYLTKTIADFRTRARGNNPGMTDLMLATAPDDLAALTEYLAGL